LSDELWLPFPWFQGDGGVQGANGNAQGLGKKSPDTAAEWI